MIDNIDFKIYKESEEMSAKELKYWRNAKKDLEKDLNSL